MLMTILLSIRYQSGCCGTGALLGGTGIWMKVNKLRFSLYKIKVLLVGKPMMQVLEYCPALNRVTLPLKEQVCSLGILLDA